MEVVQRRPTSLAARHRIRHFSRRMLTQMLDESCQVFRSLYFSWIRAGPRAILSTISLIPCSMKIRERTEVSFNHASRCEGREPDPTLAATIALTFSDTAVQTAAPHILPCSAHHMGAFDREIPHNSRDVVHRKVPAIQGGIFRDIAGWIAPSNVGDAPVCA